MKTENTIKKKLSRGASPKGLIEEGYAKSTVYKVNRELNRAKEVEIEPSLKISKVNVDKTRIQPGDIAIINYTVENASDADFYYTNYGLKPSWLSQDKWIQIEESELLHPEDKKEFEVSVKTPGNLSLGEYPVHLGLRGSFLSQNSTYPSTKMDIRYPATVLLDVKLPQTGYTVFLSHSSENKALYEHLATELYNRGIDVILAETVREPGKELKEKFAGLIEDSNVFLGLITEEAAKSEWVKFELDQAYDRDKPMLLLVEETVNLDIDIDYVPFSRDEPKQRLISKVLKNFQNVLERINQKQVPTELLWVIGGAVIGSVGTYALLKAYE